MIVFHNQFRQLFLGLMKKNCFNPPLNLLNRVNLCSAMEGGKMVLKDVVSVLESFADPTLAESWDNVGLLIEPTSPHFVSKVLLTNDLTLPVLEEALTRKTDLIISYHPPIFAPLKRITQSTWKEKIVATCLENRIAVYSPHTAWDATSGGVGDSLASAFGNYSSSVRPIIPDSKSDLMFDVVMCEEHVSLIREKVIFSLSCNLNGKQMYRITSSMKFADDLAKHPDILVTKVEELRKIPNTNIGMGRILKLKDPGCSLTKCVELVKLYTGLPHVRLVKAIDHSPDSLIKYVAMVPGSGGSILKNVKADLFLTGEMFHHDLLDASQRGISVILTNHSDSERPFLCKFKQMLSSKCPTLDIVVSYKDKDPVETV